MKWSYSHGTYKKYKKYFSKKITKVQWYTDFEQVWENIDEKTVAILPFENSYIGNIWNNYNKYLEKMHEYKVIWEIMVHAEHCLLSKEEKLSDIKHVYSADQVLDQCKNFIEAYDLKRHDYHDTAMAAEAISLWICKNAGAIAPKLAAVEYDLNVIAENVQDYHDNITRFLLITHKKNEIEFENKSDKISLHFTLKDSFSDLWHIFDIFEVYKAKVIKMNLYHTWERAFEQSICMDVQFENGTEEHNSCINKIWEYCHEINLLWVY